MKEKTKKQGLKKFTAILGGVCAMSILPAMPLLAAQTSETVSIYVDASTGSDQGAGTREAPFATLQRAQKEVRKVRSESAASVDVLLSGEFVMDQPLVLSAADSGSAGAPVTWKAVTEDGAVLSGGSDLSGWSETEPGSGIWKASAQGISSRDLYVDGQRAQLASSPLSAYEYTKKYIFVDASGLPDSFARMSDVEVVFARKWKWNIQKIASYSDNDDYENCKRFKLSDETYDNHKKNMTGAAIDAEGMRAGVVRVQNALELLDEPGEWYLDGEEDTLYYMPLDGKNPETSDIVLGRLENMIVFDGTVDAPVHDIELEGLHLTENTWNKPSEADGLQTFQGAAAVHYDDDWNREWIPETSSAVSGVYTSRLGIDGCQFDLLGDAAIHLGRSTKFASITDSCFTDLGGAAILLGGVVLQDHLPVPEDLSEGNSITDNTVRSVSQTYRGQPGIQVGFVRSTRVDHNLTENLPYTGISVGWGWGYNDFDAGKYFRLGQNSISYNRVLNVLNEEALIDGGGIYTLGRQDDSKIIGNYIDGVANEYGGIYLDEGSVGFTVTSNVLTNCVRNYLYKGDYNDIFDNYSTPAEQPDRDERLPIGDTLHYRFENNDLWDEQEVTKIFDFSGPQDNTPRVMNRLYNPNSGEHFYTSNPTETSCLAQLGWITEGSGWMSPVSGTPVYRLYNSNAGDHHYTMSLRERDYLIEAGWSDEGIGWYSSSSEATPVYRLYNPNAKTGAHHYTTDFDEYTRLAKLGWKQESIAWYGE